MLRHREDPHAVPTEAPNFAGPEPVAEALPLVSVIIPAYGCAQYIGQAVESVLKQSYLRREIVVVNDGSPDTPQLEAALRPFREAIRYIKQETGGPSGARNRGILESSGKYVAFLDGDDYWSPHHLSTQIELFRRDPGLELVYCDCVLVKDEKPLTRAFHLQPQASRVTFDSLLVEDCAIGTSTAVASRDAILRAGLFDENFVRCEDFELWLRMAFTGSRIAYHSNAEVYHRIWEQGLSADRIAMKQDRIRVYEKLAATLPVTARQRITLKRLLIHTQTELDIDILKHLLEASDYENALVVARRARERRRSWKVGAAYMGLRFAPRLFGHIHRLRMRLVRDTYYQRALAREGLTSSETAHPGNRHSEIYENAEPHGAELEGVSPRR